MCIVWKFFFEEFVNFDVLILLNFFFVSGLIVVEIEIFGFELFVIMFLVL